MASVFVIGGSAAFMQSTAGAAGPALKAVPGNPVVNERVTFSGRLTSRFERQIRLQRWTGSTWTTVTDGTVGRTGSFVLVGKMAAGRQTYRAYAPKAAGGAAQATLTQTLTSATPHGTVAFTPAAVGQARLGTAAAPATGTADLTPVKVTFTPYRTGRAVQLQRRTGGVWVKVAASTLRSGAATFQVSLPANDARPYRAVAAAFDGAAAVTSAALTPTRWRKVWADEFNTGSTADPTKWAQRLPNARFGSRLCSESSPSSVSVSGGSLHLRVKQVAPRSTECPFGEFLNGHIGTSGKFAFKHGILAARIKFPGQPGQHGSIWSQGTAAAGSEIDVVEHFGDGRKDGGLAHNVYWEVADTLAKAGNFPNANAALLPAGQDWSDGYHVYSVEWTPSRYIFRVDGAETYRTSKGVSDVEQYLILSLLTSDWELTRFDIAKAGRMSVDWVRVWQA